MSAPKRYEPNSSTFVVMLCRDHGEYVLYSDYAALAAEVERLKFELECRQRSYDFMHGQAVERMSEILRLEDENEWLRKADRLVCWNPTTQQWEVRHEALK